MNSPYSFTKKLGIRSLLFSCLAFSSLAGENQKTTNPNEYVFFSPSLTNSYLSSYNEQEKDDIEKDLKVVRDICFDQCKNDKQKQFYLATVGGPGARKSTILERFLHNHTEFSNGAYLDPDQRALRFMVHTYYKTSLNALAIAEQADYTLIRKNAYEKWRGASNYITNTLIEEALQGNRSIIHGTTATGEYIESLFKKLKEKGYNITLLLCSCQDELRAQAVTYRNTMQRFYQATPEDAVSKGKVFPARMPVYFTHGDSLYLFWSDGLFQPERLAAVLQDGKIRVMDQQALTLFANKYENDRTLLNLEGKDTLSWDDLLLMYQENHKPSLTH